jgi:hypothetical protein
MEEKLQEEMREAVRTRADTMWLQNASIYEAFVRPGLTDVIVRELESSTKGE